jgi:haloacetate dehalogenase
VSSEPAWKRLFPSTFRNERIKTSGAEINAVIGGSGPPVLMWHGAPQSLITWRLIAPDLAKDYTLVMCDLRGYGDSSKPPDGENHSNHSKRPMGLDGVEVMQHLGYDRFPVVGHDRGGRVGRRLALDHPDKVTKLAVLDIVPAHYLYSHVTLDFVRAYYHWFNYLRPAWDPESELFATNQRQLANARDDIQREYLRNSATMENIHAMCEDYRASASIDLNNDEADIKAGKKIQCPLLTLWAANGAMGRLYDVLSIWKEEGVNVSGKGLPGNHSLQESAPKETLEEIQNFLKA